MKKKYKLSTGLSTVREEPLFDTDKEAWEYLRVKLPNKFATLYRQETFKVSINNEEVYVQKHNSKYGPPPIGHGHDKAKLLKVGEKEEINEWIPILVGITNDEYLVKDE